MMIFEGRTYFFKVDSWEMSFFLDWSKIVINIIKKSFDNFGKFLFLSFIGFNFIYFIFKLKFSFIIYFKRNSYIGESFWSWWVFLGIVIIVFLLRKLVYYEDWWVLVFIRVFILGLWKLKFIWRFYLVFVWIFCFF